MLEIAAFFYVAEKVVAVLAVLFVILIFGIAWYVSRRR
jgi:hypothetical protein